MSLETTLKKIGSKGCFGKVLRCPTGRQQCPIVYECINEAKLRMFSVQPTTISKGGKAK